MIKIKKQIDNFCAIVNPKNMISLLIK